jgi:hypothetical protein
VAGQLATILLLLLSWVSSSSFCERERKNLGGSMLLYVGRPSQEIFSGACGGIKIATLNPLDFSLHNCFFYDSCNFGVLEIRTARSMLLLIRKINKFCASFLLFMVQSISN